MLDGLEGLAAIVLFFVAGAYTVTTLARLFVKWRIHARTGGVDHVALEERLTRIEASVEGIAVETQRLIEGHRFFTELLKSRSDAPALASGVRSDGVGYNGMAGNRLSRESP